MARCQSCDLYRLQRAKASIQKARASRFAAKRGVVRTEYCRFYNRFGKCCVHTRFPASACVCCILTRDTSNGSWSAVGLLLLSMC